MAPEGQVGQKEMKCILKFEKYFHMSQCYSGERCGPWASCLMSQTWFVCSFGHFGAKTTDFLMKIRESVTGQ